MDDFIWILQGMKLQKLRPAPSFKFVYSDHVFSYRLSTKKSLTFQFGMCRGYTLSGGSCTALHIKAKSTSVDMVRADLSIVVDELSWSRNAARTSIGDQHLQSLD